MYNCPFYFLQTFEVLKRLIPNPCEFATFILNEDSKWIVSGYAHSQFNILHSWCQQSLAIFFMKVPSNELITFMMRIVNDSSARTS
jgi:hypothetical protein